MNGNFIRLFLLLFVMALVVPARGRAEEPADQAARVADVVAFAKQAASTYTIRPDGPGAAFEMHPDSVLKWSNPIAGELYGNVYLWTANGRPEVVASFHRWYSPTRKQAHEFVSLSLGTVAAERNGQVVWTSGSPGVEFKPLPDAPVPAGTPAQRMRQLRELSREFAARQTSRNGVDQELRLLTQPIDRYEKTEDDLIDGGLFVFALGTDPQAFVLLEARRVDGGAQWQYAFARMNNVPLRATYRGREIWSVPAMPPGEAESHRRPYTNFRFDVPEPSAKPEAR